MESLGVDVLMASHILIILPIIYGNIRKSSPGPNSASGGPCEGWLIDALPLDGNYFRLSYIGLDGNHHRFVGSRV